MPPALAGSLENQPLQTPYTSPAPVPAATRPVQNAVVPATSVNLPVQAAHTAEGVAGRIALVASEQEVLPSPPGESTPSEGEVTVVEEEFDSLDQPNYLWGDVRNLCGSCCQSGLYVGVEGLYLAPFDEPEQRVTFTDLVASDSYSGASNPSLGTGVRSWIGMQSSGRGFRISYTHLGNENIEPIPSVPINAQPSFLETYSLNTNTLDVELTH